ncbi:MAG: uroporphyrinogen decarboxylase, partial [Acidimicrobiales bacterium]|nr:uroporphyrinogen decarboxylase [Acidimicrobiales bacterium]
MDINNRFLAACRGENVDRVPVWFMRQAGRSLPEYREIRGVGSILEILTDPELSAKITLQPVDRHGVDAAVLYSDIVVPLKAFHVDVDIVPGVGPVVSEPLRTKNDLAKLIDKKNDPDFGSLSETIKIVCKKAEVPLIGFAGGPYTVACYLVEGHPSKSWIETRKLFLTDPVLFGQLLDYLCDISFESAKKQVQSGASAIQIFDSWIGSLSRQEYLEFV